MELAAISLVGVLLAIVIAGVIAWALSYFGAPQILVVIVAVIVFLICLKSGVTL